MKLNGPLVPPRIAAVSSALQICVFLGKEQVAQRESKKNRQGKFLFGDLDLGAVFYPDPPEESKKQHEGTFQPIPSRMRLFTLWRA